MIVFIGMETSGALRRRFQALGHECYSCDVLPSEDGGEEMSFEEGLPRGRHLVGDVFEALDNMWATDLWPDLAIFHPTCTYLTNAAEWAFADPDFERYPGVGFHQRVQPGTLVGAKRRAAREAALNDVRRLMALPIGRKVIENPKGAIGSAIRPPDQVIQPNQFGDDASKGTCLWLDGLPKLRPTGQAPGRLVDDGRPQLGLFGTGVERWSNQTDGGQNKLAPSADRWKERSRTYPGIAEAMASQWGRP
jgi:hypothetical protein